MLRFLRDVHHRWRGELHSVGEFVLCDSGDGLGVADRLRLPVIELVERIKRITTARAVHALGIAKKEHRLALRTALHPLMDRRQETASPNALAGVGRLAAAG